MMQKQKAMIRVLLVLLLCVMVAVRFPWGDVVRADGPQPEWFTTQLLFTAADYGWSQLDPWIIRMPNGSLWAVAVNRLTASNDTRVRKSYDYGATWTSAVQWNIGIPNGKMYGNVVKGTRVFVAFYVQPSGGSGNSDTYLMYSDDNGISWSSPFLLFDGDYGTKRVIPYNIGVTVGSRMIMPSIYMEDILGIDYYSTGYWYSDTDGDQAGEWFYSINDPTYPIYSSEAGVVSLINGSLWCIMRNSNDPGIPTPYGVWGSFSTDGSAENGSWTSPYELNNVLGREDMKEAPVHACRFTLTPSTDKNRLLIAWCNCTELPGSTRDYLTVAISFDEAQSFPYSKTIDCDDGQIQTTSPSLIVLDNNNTIGLGYAKQNAGGTALALMKFARFSVEWLTGSEDYVIESYPPGAESIAFVSIDGKVNESVFYDTTPSFVWNRINNTGVYNLQIANDSSFADIMVDIVDVCKDVYPAFYTNDSYFVTFVLPPSFGLVVGKDYFFRVRAYVED